MKGKPSQPVMKDLEGYMTPSQIDRVLSKAKNDRNRLIILIGWRTGRRITEILQLKVRDIDFDKSLVKWRILKKRDKNYIKLKPIDKNLLFELRKYTKGMDMNDYIFPSPYIEGQHLGRKQVYNIIRDTSERAGIMMVGNKPPHPHNLRHSFAVHFLRSTHNPTTAIKVLQNILEHSSIEETATYLQFSQEDIKDELDRIFA